MHRIGKLTQNADSDDSLAGWALRGVPICLAFPSSLANPRNLLTTNIRRT